MNSTEQYWAQFTPEERRRMMQERQAKWSQASIRAWRNQNRPAKQSLSPAAKTARQKLYAARDRARRKGLAPAATYGP